MSSSDRGSARRAPWGAVAAAALAMTLAACTAQPLYGTGFAGGGVPATLSGISIEPVDTRVAQQVRNRLLFELDSRPAGAAPYSMAMTVTTSEAPIGVTPVDSAPATLVTVTATVTVTETGTTDIAFRDTVRASASFDLVNQAFSNSRARLDAENRAAIEVARIIRTELSAAAARGVF